jgi:hypothetical protein
MKRRDDTSATLDEAADGSWMQRARAEQLSRHQSVGNADFVVSPAPLGQSQGWDPYEVWLSRIERPRRKRQDMPGT